MFSKIGTATISVVAPSISTSQQEMLKIFAVVAMLIGHIGAAFSTGDMFSYGIGRVAFPLFAFLMVYNYHHYTSSPIKYITRIFIVAVIAQAPYQLLFQSEGIVLLNIMFTLAAGLVIVTALDYMIACDVKLKQWTVGYMMGIFFVVSGMYVDYIYLGLILIISYWAWIKFPSHTTLYIAIATTLFLNFPSGIWMMASGLMAFAILLVAMNVNVELKRKNKWLFYSFYPVHLLILHIVKTLG